MPRPVNADAQATKRRILESALRLFSERGLDGTSIRDVAAEAKVSLGMVRHYFGSKDQLYEACIDRMYAELATLQAGLQTDLAGGHELAELLESAVRRGFRFARAHQIAVRLLLREFVDAGELSAKRRDRTLLPFLALGSTLIGARAGRSPEELRLPMQTALFIVSRYATTSEAELTAVVGPGAAAVDMKRNRGEGASDNPVLLAVEDHLVDIVLPTLTGKSS